MAPKTKVSRTVQYWRLVDARDGTYQDEIDWHDYILKDLYGKRLTFNIDGRDHSGTVRSVQITEDWADAMSVGDVEGAPPFPDPTTTYGIVIAAAKDYVPNQENSADGSQKAMGLEGKGWEPVDNLFVTFLPFGNMIAVLAESTSSSRASKFAQWLSKALRHRFDDPEFSWAAIPVIDPTRAEKLQHAKGLKAATYAGEIGSDVVGASGLRDFFYGGDDEIPARIRIEIKASVVRGKSDHSDEAKILDWFTENFGEMTGEVAKAQVTIAETDEPDPEDTGPTEIDLLHHRVTRKTSVPLATGSTKAFRAESAVAAILNAFTWDRADLLRLRGADTE